MLVTVALCVARAAAHRLGHRHVALTRGAEELVLCGGRAWWSWLPLGHRPRAWYRPHRHAEWRLLDHRAALGGAPWHAVVATARPVTPRERAARACHAVVLRECVT